MAYFGDPAANAYAVDAASGKLLWKTPHPDCGTRKPCGNVQAAAVTAIPGVVFSGSMSNGGVAVVDGMLYTNSGYSHHSGIMPGNVFLAFGVEHGHLRFGAGMGRLAMLACCLPVCVSLH